MEPVGMKLFVYFIWFSILGFCCGTPYWGTYTDFGCTDCVRLYGARIWNYEQSWEESCKNTLGQPTSTSTPKVPALCLNYGFFSGMWGYWRVQDSSCAPQLEWGTATGIGCYYPGKRRYYSKLVGISHADWMLCCVHGARVLPINIAGRTYRNPNACTQSIFGVYGFFDVPDNQCISISTDTSQTCKIRRRRSTEEISPTINKTVSPTRVTRSLKNVLIEYIVTEPEIRWTDISQFETVTKPSQLCPPAPPGVCPSPIVATVPESVSDWAPVQKLVACIRPCNLNQGTATNENMRNRAKHLGEDNVEQISEGRTRRVSDDAGHILGRQLGGVGTQARNIFPQNVRCNRGNTDGFQGQNRGWTELENYIKEQVGHQWTSATVPVVTVVYELLYDPNVSNTRPIGLAAEVFSANVRKGFVTPNPSNTEA